jgi:hypothetical protein
LVAERILDEPREQVRLREGREPQPSAGVIDSQSVKAADAVGCDSRCQDAKTTPLSASVIAEANCPQSELIPRVRHWLPK